MPVGNSITVLFCLSFLLLLVSCAHSPAHLHEEEILYRSPLPPSLKAPDAPAFLIKKAGERYNKIGMPSVRESTDQETEIFVDPDKPAIFFETQEFTTARGTYQNLLYRIHFEQVPFALDKINLTAGKNPGLLIIYTLDANGQLLLVTTVHTCGCFLAFFPTDAMPPEAFPADWPAGSQRVYSYNLPSLLQPARSKAPENIVFTLESETHRISNVAVRAEDTLKQRYDSVELDLFPMNYLYRLPFKDRTKSFFYMSGPCKGYVRNNTKFLERLLISWWAFDFHVGQDKAIGLSDTSGIIFYTSLKFWDREASDLKNFPRFLEYWGWKM